MATSRSNSRDDKLLTKAKQQEQEQQEIIPKDLNTNEVTLLLQQPIITTDQLTTVFDPSKIKKFLYKEEPNMAILNGPSLDLISTTAALFLKSIVEKAIRLDDDNGSCLQQQQQQQQQRNKEEDEGQTQTQRRDLPKQFLITSTHLKRVISSNPSLEFLQETYENVIDKDGSARMSSLREYIPAVKKVKVKQVKKRVAANLSSSSINQSDSKDENENNNNNKRRRKTDSGTCTSSTFINNNTDNKDDNSLFSSDDAPLEKAIADAANTNESRMLETIIADEDDYD